MLRSQLLVALGLARLLATVLPKVYWPVLLHGEDEEEGRAKSVPKIKFKKVSVLLPP